MDNLNFLQVSKAIIKIAKDPLSFPTADSTSSMLNKVRKTPAPAKPVNFTGNTVKNFNKGTSAANPVDNMPKMPGINTGIKNPIEKIPVGKEDVSGSGVSGGISGDPSGVMKGQTSGGVNAS